MGQYVVRRLLATIVVLFLVTLVSFSIMSMVPGDPAVVMAGVGASADQVQRIREQFGLDAPFPVRLGRWYGGLLHGDLGQSILLSRSVAQAIAERLPATLSLAVLAFVLTAVGGITLGTLAALRQGSWVDHAVMTLAVIGVSVPGFWLGLILIVLFSVMRDWLPAGGYVPFGQSPGDWLRALVLPAVSLALLQVGLLARITRSTVAETLRQDFVRTARAKGLSGWAFVGRHAFANATVPVVTVLGISVSLLLSGSVVVETVFSIPGLGRLMATAILARDYPVIQGGLLVTALLFVLMNLAVDVLYAWLDPRSAMSDGIARPVRGDAHPSGPWAGRRPTFRGILAVGAGLCVAMLAVAILAGAITRQPPERVRMRDAFARPGADHPFGADNLGRDILSRVLHGTRVSLGIGLATAALTGVAGTLLGCAAGYFRRWDEPLMRVMDALMAFPAILLAVAITAALGPSAVNVVIALVAVYTPRTARIVRASVLVTREMEYVSASRALGAQAGRTLFRHVLPNCLTPLVVQVTFVFAYAVLAEAALSFLGMGPPPPTPTWGNVIADGRDYLREAPWICLFPGAAISATVLGLNLLGDGLRDLLDPRLRTDGG